MSDVHVDGDAQPGAKNLIRGYEQGEAFKPAEVVKSSDAAEAGDVGERALAKNLISSFEQGHVKRASLEVSTEKPEINEAFARNLISSFERIKQPSSSDAKSHEKPVTRPGVTEKLKKQYESFDKSETKTSSKSATVAESKTTTENVTENTAESKTATENENEKMSNAQKKSQGEITKMKTVLVVFAHWKRKTSFNGAMYDVALTTLKESGYNVLTSDLYALKWNPVVSKEDFGGKLFTALS